MKTAISVPDGTFSRVDAAAKRLGVSRSEFFATAAERWLRDLEEAATTAQIDAVLETLAAHDDSAFLARAAREVARADDAW